MVEALNRFDWGKRGSPYLVVSLVVVVFFVVVVVAVVVVVSVAVLSVISCSMASDERSRTLFVNISC